MIKHDPYAEELARHLQHEHGCGHLVTMVATWAAGRSTLSGAPVSGGEVVREHVGEIIAFHGDHHPPGGPVELHHGIVEVGPPIEGSFEDA